MTQKLSRRAISFTLAPLVCGEHDNIVPSSFDRPACPQELREVSTTSEKIALRVAKPGESIVCCECVRTCNNSCVSRSSIGRSAAAETAATAAAAHHHTIATIDSVLVQGVERDPGRVQNLFTPQHRRTHRQRIDAQLFQLS